LNLISQASPVNVTAAIIALISISARVSTLAILAKTREVIENRRNGADREGKLRERERERERER
jgi:hypothetical protein